MPSISTNYAYTHIFKEIAGPGIKTIIAGLTDGKLVLHFLDRLGIAVRNILSKFDMRWLC